MTAQQLLLLAGQALAPLIVVSAAFAVTGGLLRHLVRER